MNSTILTALFWLCAIPAAASAQELPRLEAARELVAGIDADHNEYSYKDPYVHWKGVDGADAYEVHCDCSGFIDALEKHADGLTPDDFKRLTGFKHPHARQWYQAVARADAGSALTRIDKLTDAIPGDFLVTAYPPDEGKVDTGHIMLLVAAPMPRTASKPLVDGTTQWDVPVIDSSKSFHGPADTRHRADGTSGSGVGQGTLRLYTNPDNTVAGYAWSDSIKSVYVPQSEHPFVIGRLDEAVARSPAGRG